MKAALLLAVVLAGCAFGAIVPDDLDPNDSNTTVSFSDTTTGGSTLEVRYQVTGNDKPLRRMSAMFDVPETASFPFTVVFKVIVYDNINDPPHHTTRKRAASKVIEIPYTFTSSGQQVATLDILAADPNLVVPSTGAVLALQFSAAADIALVPVSTSAGLATPTGGYLDPQGTSGASTPFDPATFGFTLFDTGKCGDDVVDTADGEICDLVGDPNCENCLACLGGATTGPDSTGCYCPAAPAVQAHAFDTPATLAASLADGKFDLTVTVPQALAYDKTMRRDGKIEIISAVDGTPVSSFASVAMTDSACSLVATLNDVSVAQLVSDASPIVTEHDSYYAVQFALKASWTERVQLTARSTETVRNVEARLNFNLNIRRIVETSGNITVASSKVLWAYVKRGVLMMPAIPADPYMEIELETLTDGQGVTVSALDYVSTTGNAIKSVSNALLVANLNVEKSYQKWSLKVYLKREELCGLNSQAFKMQYTLAPATGSGFQPATFPMDFTLSGLEKLCDTQNNISMTGSQSQYTDSTFSTSASRYLTDSIVYVKVTVSPPYGLTVSDVEPQSAIVGGAATNDVDVVVLGTGASPVFEGSVVPACGATTEGCYKFKLDRSSVSEGKVLVISSSVKVSLSAARRRRAALSSVEGLFTDSHIVVDRRPSNGATLGELAPGYLIAVGILATVAIVSVVGAIIVVVRVTRSRRSEATANSL